MLLELTDRDRGPILIAVDKIITVKILENYGRCQIVCTDGVTHNVQETYDQVREMLGHPSPEDVKNVRLKLGISMQSAVNVLKHCRRELRFYEENLDVGDDT